VVIKPSSLHPHDEGRWHSVFDGPLSVKWFGAIGDGNTDDIGAIQTCVDVAAATPVPSLQFPPGRYRITRAMLIQTEDFTISSKSNATIVVDPAPAIESKARV
jgi:polygalacturonase